MPNPVAPTEGGGRRIPFLVDPDNPGTAYLQAGEGGIDMGTGRTEGAAVYVLFPPADTATRTSVPADDADGLLLAANALRRGFTVFNDATVMLSLALGTAAATTSDFTVEIPAGGYYEPPAGVRYTGEVRGIWGDATGSATYGYARVTEFTTEAWMAS